MLRRCISLIIVLAGLLAPLDRWGGHQAFARDDVRTGACEVACDLTCIRCISPCDDCVCTRLTVLPSMVAATPVTVGSNSKTAEFAAPAMITLTPDPPPPR